MKARSRFGPRLEPHGGVTFRLWAPAAKRVALIADYTVPLTSVGGGWFEATAPHAGAGLRYKFRIDDELEVPDPASHFQPQDVSGPSEVIAHDYAWRCTEWKGRPWHEAVILELHVGTFTPAGTFPAMIERLDHLVDTGVTAIELMPLADFAGGRNWGYDGVLLYAPDSAYGRPEDLKAFVDAAHARGLLVLLDVVYNHFGPEGNYLGRYAPAFFTSHHHTPWGDAIDYRVPEVRAFAIENALHWLTHYRFDGLRLDAVHAINEPGDPPILQDLSEAVGELAAHTGRHIHLVLENDDNRAALLDPATDRPSGKYRAQWNDDYHHAWHVLLTGESRGYYCDYVEAPRRSIARALATGFVYQGEPSAHRGGAARGEPSGKLPPAAFINFLQNHDQIGNRAYGDRLTTLAAPETIEAALAITLLAPSPPLLFMAEEWGSTQPFPFFCDFAGDLAEAVRRGRKAEFEAQFSGLTAENPLPDPLAEETFRSAVLAWDDRERAPHAARLKLVRELLAARHRYVVPALATLGGGSAEAEADGAVLRASWRGREGETLALLANLGAEAAPRPRAPAQVDSIWGGVPPEQLPPWSVYWWRERR
ncbi:MAG TPA: malto-oligosyltrehalose trehalohydrolase [Xanthobacteraceae bacterium]|nr:malto-oligosyltrehalose trehalohydrolase [Xanthobacteraceae bacterium]